MAAHRYWRIIMPSTGYYVVGELSFRTTAAGANAAVGGTPFARSESGNAFATSTAAQAYDNNSVTAWSSSNNAANEHLGYDFVTAKDIVEIAITSQNGGDGAAAPTSGNVQWSDDNVTYTTVSSFSSGTYAQGETKVFTVSVAATAHNLTAATSAQSNASQVGAIPTGTWTVVPGGEGGSMNFASPTYLRYGANTSWAYLYASGTITFNNATFGDPIPGTAKNGYYFVASAGTNNLTDATSAQSNTSSTGAVAVTKSLTVATSSQANAASAAAVSIPGSGTANLVGAASVQTSTSGTGAIAVGNNTKNLTVAASTQSAFSSTSSIQIVVPSAAEPVAPQSFNDWLLSQSAIRCVLIEVVAKVGGVETTRYLSNKPYVTSATDTPANTAYLPVVAGGVEFTEKLSLDGSTSMSYGDIELHNVNGERDSWLTDIWRNRSIKVYMGDVRWTRSQFVMIFNGLVFDVDSRSREKINLKLTDKLQRLNNPITENKLGGTGQTKDTLIPLCFGECFNVTPLLTNAATLEYQVHDGAIERIIEVRDNGVPCGFTEFIATGKFKLNQSPVGTITCSVQGDKYLGYINDIGSIIERIVTGFGLVGQKFTGADIDSTKLAAFKTANTAPVGIYISERTNILEACNQLAASVGARVAMSRGGLMSLIKIDLPRSDAGTTVTASDMKERSLSIIELPEVVASSKVGYAKNWSVESNIQTGIPADHVAMFGQEWLTVTASDSTVATNYNLFKDPTMEETLLLKGTDATTECNRRLNLYKTQRKVVQYEGYPHLLTEALGNTQTVKHSRFGLSSGVAGQIVSIQTNWLNPKVTMEILI